MKSKNFPLAKFSTLPLLCASLGMSMGLQADENALTAEGKAQPWASQKIAPSVFNKDLRELKPSPQWQVGEAIKTIPRVRNDENYKPPGAPKNPVLLKSDPLMSKQKQIAANSSQNTRAVELQIEGMGYTGVNPPDTTGDVGMNYYIQSINGSSGSQFSIYDKTNGTLVSGPTNMETLGSGNCASGAGDPIVLYDEMADRWLMSEFSSFGNNLCVYISQTSDPVSGGWFAYSFASPTFPDYPKYGVGVDAYYVGTNESSPTVYALDRTAMLAGNAAGMVRLVAADLAGFGFQMIQPADHEGSTDMPAGTPGYFLRHRDDEVHNAGSNNPTEDYIELWEFNVDFNNTNNSTFTKVNDFAVAEFDSDLCGLFSFFCFPQAGSSTTLDPLREVVMFRAQYRNFTDYEVIVGNLVVDVDGTDHGGIRWFELRRENGSWSLHQEGTYSPDEKNRWMGSIAMDKDGNIALAYSWGSSVDFPGIRYTGRLATDAAGLMTEAETTLVNGTSHNASNRWGDYSHLALDPVDECSFWYTNQYGRQNGQWGTHITRFRFDSCGGGTGNQPPNASYTFSCTDLSCDFDATASSDSDGTVDSYSWDFGDGNSATGATPSHAFSAGGTFSVVLTVTDNEGATDTSTQSVTVVDPNGPVTGGFTETDLAPSSGEILNYTIDVPANATLLEVETSGGTGNVDLAINFGSAPTRNDNDCLEVGAGNDHTCSITNPAEGTWFIVVRGAAASSGVQLDAYWTAQGGGSNVAPTADFSFTTNDLVATFTDNSSDSDGSVVAWDWDFGDGNTSSSQNPTNSYASAGTYSVTLTVTDDDGATDSSTQSVTVSDGGGNSGGFTETGLAPAAGEVLSYTIDVPAGATSLEVDISGGTGNADLAINFGSMPTRFDNDCIQTGAGNNHSCNITNPSEGTWFIVVRGAAASSGVQLDAYWFQ